MKTGDRVKYLGSWKMWDRNFTSQANWMQNQIASASLIKPEKHREETLKEMSIVPCPGHLQSHPSSCLWAPSLCVWVSTSQIDPLHTAHSRCLTIFCLPGCFRKRTHSASGGSPSPNQLAPSSDF